MSKKFQLQIPEPCHEDWNKMTPGDKGRFCDSCQKTVHDFTGMSDAQLIAFFKKPSTASFCGRFLDDQLDRSIEIPRKRIPWVKYFFQFTIPIFLTSLKVQSQVNLSLKERTCSPTTDEKNILRGTVGAVALFDDSKKILGRVRDEKGIGIPYASVYIKGTTSGVSCDSVGLFELSIPSLTNKITLIASCVGYSEKEMQINFKKASSTEITLPTNARLNGEVVVTAVGITRKMTSGLTVRIERISYLQKAKDYFVGDSVKVFPNPAKAGDQIKIEWRKAPAGEYKIDLYSLQGQLIKSSLAKIEKEIKSFSFQIPATTPGSYLLRMTNKKSGKKNTEKIIIQ